MSHLSQLPGPSGWWLDAGSVTVMPLGGERQRWDLPGGEVNLRLTEDWASGSAGAGLGGVGVGYTSLSTSLQGSGPLFPYLQKGIIIQLLNTCQGLVYFIPFNLDSNSTRQVFFISFANEKIQYSNI